MDEAVRPSALYPEIQPHRAGSLPVADGHVLAWEQCGNPAGLPVVVLHGGPGAGCTAMQRRFFDPAAYRIVLFDQRGAGRSTPHASLHRNTTADLVADIEALRDALGIGRWLVFGGSWGSTLALAYAQAHPRRCLGLVLRGVWLCRPDDLAWQFHGLRGIYPEYWRDFAAWLPEAERGDPIAAYLRRLVDPDPAVHLPAAARWNAYEARCSRLHPMADDEVAALPPRLALARIEAHYMRHAAFLRPRQLLDAVPRLRHLPAVVVHGRYDMLCRIDAAFALVEGWSAARLVVVPDAGHSAGEPGIQRALVAATDGFRSLAVRRARQRTAGSAIPRPVR
jgi:proline iminopeptidase